MTVGVARFLSLNPNITDITVYRYQFRINIGHLGKLYVIFIIMDIRVYVDVGIIQNRGHRYFINVKYLIILENQILYIQSIISQSVNEYFPLF